MNIQNIIEKYRRKEEKLFNKILEFKSGKYPFLIALRGPDSYIYAGKNVKNSFETNMVDFNEALDLPSDTLPFLKPWFGCGIVAEAFGAKYYWWENEAPTCHPQFNKIEEVFNIPKPDITKAKMINKVMDSIIYFKEKTKNKIPICITDTQSAFDTAALILNSTEVFISTYTEPKKLHQFLQTINDLTIEFSKMQIEVIGDALASPGHCFYNSTIKSIGLALSDDHLANVSSKIGNDFLLPYDKELGKFFGGIAIHSCGSWSHMMSEAKRLENIIAIDCALEGGNDPHPNKPEEVRDVFKGTNIIVQVRINPDVEQSIEIIKRLWADNLRLVICTFSDGKNPQYQYDKLRKTIEDLYQ